MPGKIKNWKDFGSSLFLLALALFMAVHSMEFEIWRPGGPKAGFFPLVIAVVIIGISLAITVESWSARGTEKGTLPSEGQGKGVETPLRVFFYALLMLLFGLSIKTIGFFFVTPLFLIVLLKFVEKERWKATIMIGVLTTIASYLMFKLWLQVPLPMGLMRGWYFF